MVSDSGTARGLASAGQPDRLFAVLAEQLKVPFLQVAQAVELATHINDGKNYNERGLAELTDTVQYVTDAALRLIDGYLLSMQMQQRTTLELEPVSLSSVLYDTAQNLDAFARAHGCRLELQVEGKFGPVMAQKPALEAALLGLGHSFIEAAQTMAVPRRARGEGHGNGALVVPAVQPASGTPAALALKLKQHRQRTIPVTLLVRRTSRGICAGVFSPNAELGAALLKQARALYGTARRPLGAFSSASGAGVFIADSLFAELDTSMHTAHYKKLHGLAATLMPSRQLSLV